MRYSAASLDEEVRRSHFSRYDRVHSSREWKIVSAKIVGQTVDDEAKD